MNEASRMDIESTRTSTTVNHELKKRPSAANSNTSTRQCKQTAQASRLGGGGGRSVVSNASSLSSLSKSSLSINTTPSSSLSSLNISSLHSSRKSSSAASQNTLIDKTSLASNGGRPKLKRRGGGEGDSSTLIIHRAKLFDSNDFNYWFECSSITSGVIKFDLTLDKGNPEEQLKFLRMHDAHNRYLYFLWQTEASANGSGAAATARCGCNGGCYFYSVFPDAETFEFFNLDKSISRANKLFGDSLFSPGVHILKVGYLTTNKNCSVL